MAVQSRANDDRRRGERHGINPEFAALDPGTVTYVSNLSEYGVFIHTRVRLPVGAAVDLRFTVLLDDPVVIHGPGRVVHHQDEPRGMGVVFVNLRAEMQLRVIDAINWYRARANSTEAGDRVFRTRELTPDELAQIDEEDGDESDEADESSDDPAAESVTSLSSSDMVAESGNALAYLNASIEELRPEDIEAATSAHAAASRRAAPKTPPAPAPPPKSASASPPPTPLKDDEYEDF
jgi:hypothetical protein